MTTIQIERLAYWLWQQRGKPVGSPEEDWFRAEEVLRPQLKRFELPHQEMRLFACGIERRTR